jgi:hypothetical protein
LTSGLVKRYLPLVFMPRRQLLKTLVQLMDAGEKSLGSWLRSSRLARVLGRITPASGRLLRLEKLRKVTATAIPFSGENVMAGSLRGVMPSLQIAVYFYHKGNRGHIQGLLRKLGQVTCSTNLSYNGKTHRNCSHLLDFLCCQLILCWCSE